MDSDLKTVCPLCGSHNHSSTGRPKISKAAAEFINKDYLVVRCNDCGFFFVDPKINFSGEAWEKLYGAEYFSELTGWWQKRRSRDRRLRLDLLERLYENRVRRFLDIGCGEGAVLIEAFNRGWEVHGLDIYDNRNDEARDEKIHFIKSDLFNSSFPNRHFDCVYLDSVLEHVLDPVRLLLEVRRILADGGCVYIGVPNEDSLLNDFKKIVFTLTGHPDLSTRAKPFVSPYHVVGFNKKLLKLILKSCGFEALRLRNFSGQYEWRKHKAFTRMFFIQLLLLPLHLLSIPLGKRIYLDVVARKIGDKKG
ncbi:MAG: class I SAM-dependent methyltransferase [Candidatus Zixiibacteriota bacterium]|nr:MAG: class I SAM-dependent methyltransferase [candidate division Zixibacteria bacterium]